tara:strand:- start:7829 stop:8284 length:456 start_codon:yes stop_codon:yes gene_type:complete
MKQIFTRERLITIIVVFFITGIWDVILRAMSEGYIDFLGIENMKWVTTLKDYFKYHTVLGAALLAAFVAAIAYILIIYTFDLLNVNNIFNKIVIVFFISALVGIPMRYSGLFPILNKHYYEPLGFTYSFITDGMSGVVVAITLFFLQLFIN